ncbi:MAG: undecaprenyl-diphosphate phosphatase [SAR202 cluster bacterium]|nr:undecaprenyl-diphosphate phosphatase [SAR202 cluster bacterium]
MLETIILGVIQGITEWLPVSSEGLVAATSTLLFGNDPSTSIGITLWLHIGTACSAIVIFRKKILKIVKQFITSPQKPTNESTFLIISVTISALIGLPIIILIEKAVSTELLQDSTGIFTALIGVFMVVTGILIRNKNITSKKDIDNVTKLDAFMTGIAQGIAAIPGLSRSGLTTSILLIRGTNKSDSLTLSFLIGIPATIGAGLYSVLSESINLSIENCIGLIVSFVTGLITIKILLKLAEKMNLGNFVFLVGLTLIFGSILLFQNY